VQKRSTDRPLTAGVAVSATEPAADAAVPGIAPHTAARSQPPVRAVCRPRRGRRYRRTRRRCAERHPRRSISVSCFAAALTGRFPSNAICGVNRLETTGLQFSGCDTRDRYLACRQPNAHTARKPSARAPCAPASLRPPAITMVPLPGAGLRAPLSSSPTTASVPTGPSVPV
jgi:hypothetical protein